MRLSDFDFELPPELIASRPAERRDQSRLMVLPAAGGLEHRSFSDLTELLGPGDLLVVNDSKVLAARLKTKKATGAAVQVLLTEPAAGGYRAMLTNHKKLKLGTELFVEGLEAPLVVLAKEEGGFARLSLPLPVSELCARFGQIPLPPYMGREADDADALRYQTVYAEEEGSVAAPTAGLHFTEELLAKLERKGVRRAAVTLHVGPGTFLPVRTDDVSQHVMHTERFSLGPEAAQAIEETRAAGGRIVAVGTTATRVLESLEDATVPQSGLTQLFIRPGHTFKWVDSMITNFHLPRSTLLMLVSAMVGRERLLAAYAQAVAEAYRFYSYGDAMFIEGSNANRPI